jgi:hypothetical protein
MLFNTAFAVHKACFAICGDRMLQVPEKDTYNFVYRRGNEYHVKEHQEVANPHTGQFKIQVRLTNKNYGIPFLMLFVCMENAFFLMKL